MSDFNPAAGVSRQYVIVKENSESVPKNLSLYFPRKHLITLWLLRTESRSWKKGNSKDAKNELNASLTVKKSCHETLLMFQCGRLTQQHLSQVMWWELFLEAGEKWADPHRCSFTCSLTN